MVEAPEAFITSFITVRNHDGTPEMERTSARREASTSRGSFVVQSSMRAVFFEGMRKRLTSGLMRSISVADRSPTFTPVFSPGISLAKLPPRMKFLPPNTCESG